MNAEAEMAAWHSWHRACAFDLLEEKERAWLKKVVGDRFRSRVRKLKHCGIHLPSPENTVCAGCFETWCALHTRQDGKRYKDWLLNRGRRDLDTVQSGVMLLVRNVVREWIRDSQPTVAELSLDQPLPEAGGLCLFELLPERIAAEHPVQKSWAESRAAHLMEEAEPLERAVLRVRGEGRVFSHPQVRADTGYGKTVMHESHRQLLEKVAGDVKDEFPDLNVEESSALVLDILDQASELILLKLSAEKGA